MHRKIVLQESAHVGVRYTLLARSAKIDSLIVGNAPIKMLAVAFLSVGWASTAASGWHHAVENNPAEALRRPACATTSRASLLAMAAAAPEAEKTSSSATDEPLLLRAARGEKVERTPVWMMRQAGRHMAAYRALVSKYPTFRERSETPEVSLEVSLQPWKAYGVDGVILFSDIRESYMPLKVFIFSLKYLLFCCKKSH